MSEASPASAAHCFHCGDAGSPKRRLPHPLDGRTEPACCHGCQAVAQTIIDSGNAD